MIKKQLSLPSATAHTQVTRCPLLRDGWEAAVDLATAALIRYFSSESIKNILTKCTLHFSHVINLLLYLKTILLPMAGIQCASPVSGGPVKGWCRSAKEELCAGCCGGGMGDVQGMSVGFARDTARSKPWYSLQPQLVNAGWRSAKPLPTLWKGMSLGHGKNVLHSP